MSNCRICNTELTSVDTGGICRYCKQSLIYGCANLNFGWVCPKCGRVFSFFYSRMLLL